MSDTSYINSSQNVYVFFAFLFKQRKVLLIDRLERNAFLLGSMTLRKSEGKQFPLKNDNQLLLLRVSSRANRFSLSYCYCGKNSRYLFSLIFNVIKFVGVFFCTFTFVFAPSHLYLNNVVFETGHVRNFSLLLVPWNVV